jgi:phosphocarrier protein
MKEISYTLKDLLGIHARPAGLLVRRLQGFGSAVTVSRGGGVPVGQLIGGRL